MKALKRLSLVTLFLSLALLPMKAQEIRDAIRNGDLAKVKEMVEADPQLAVSKIDRNNTPLHIAARNNQLEIAKYLVVKGADVNAVSKYQGTPLDLAIEAGNKEIIGYLESTGGKATDMPLETKKINENLLRITFPYGMRNNLVAFRGTDGIMLIESGFGKRTVEAIRKTVNDFDKGQISLVINTHSHGDHVMGNKYLAPSDSAVIGSGKIREGRTGNRIKKAGKILAGRSGKNLPYQYDMKFNGQDIVFFPYPGLHSEEDLLIYFPQSKVLCMGDLLLSENCPAINGNVIGYIDFLDRIIDIFPDDCTFISGHGKDIDYAGLRKYRNDLFNMTAIVRREFKNGSTADEMIRADILKTYRNEYSFLDWLDPDFWINVVCNDLKAGRL